MNLNQLHYFVTLAHIEHYTRAAEMLSITQPSLSHAISMLEQELETNLFEKRGRNVVLTKYGKVFLEYVEEALKILDSGVKKTRALTSDTGGVIDLAYIFTLGSVFVPQLVGGFLKEHEDWDVNFRFSVGNTTEIIQGLKEEKYDIAFCSRKEKESGIDFVPIAKEKLVVVVPRDHELAGRGSVDLKETLPYPQVYFTKNSGLRPVIDQLFEQTGGTPKIAYEILEDASMAGLVAENFGIAVMPEIPILKNLNVDVLDIENPPYERYIYLAKLKEKYLAPVVKEFIEYVKDPGNKGDSEIFGNQGSNCVFIRTLTDDVYIQLLFFIEVTGEATESGIAVIPDQRIVGKVTATDGFFLDKRMFFWSNYNHILVQNGYKGNIRFICNERTKDHIVAVGFEPLDHICSVRLVKIEGYMLVAVYIQEGSHCMRNIVVCQRKYIGDINMSAASGKLLHLMLGNMYLLEDPVDMFQEDAAGFGEDNIAALMFKKHQSKFFFQKRHGPAEAWLGDLK